MNSSISKTAYRHRRVHRYNKKPVFEKIDYIGFVNIFTSIRAPDYAYFNTHRYINTFRSIINAKIINTLASLTLRGSVQQYIYSAVRAFRDTGKTYTKELYKKPESSI